MAKQIQDRRTIRWRQRGSAARLSLSDRRMKRFLIMLVVSGIAASALYYGSNGIGGHVFGRAWLSPTRHALIDCGVPSWFVTGYIAFALLRVYTWVVLAIACFGIGISRASWGRRFAVMLAVWLTVVEFISDLFYCFNGGEHVQSYHAAMLFLFSFRIRFVSLWGVAIGIGAWYLGKLCTRLSTRSSELPPAGALVIAFTTALLCHAGELSRPALDRAAREAIITAANQAFQKHVQSAQEARKGTEIAKESWGDSIAHLKPLRVRDDRANIFIVLKEDEAAEEGLYVSIPISSYAPGMDKRFVLFETLTQPGDKAFGQLYYCKLRKAQPSEPPNAAPPHR